MVQIRRSADCGNSPKNRFAEQYVIALLTGDLPAVQRGITSDVRNERLFGEVPAEIEIENVVTHGKVGAVSGSLITNNGRSAGFCFVLVFATAKADRVSKITRYTL